jgi:aminopeptidase-like protein
VIEILEGNMRYQNTNPYCEPQLGKRGLYNLFGGTQNTPDKQMAILWTLNLSDGQHSLLNIAERSRMPFAVIKQVADRLCEQQLLKTVHAAVHD